MSLRAIVGSILLLGITTVAHAGNAGEPRVPATFPGGSCLEHLQAGDPPLHLDVGIPREDHVLTGDEPTDSRTFQFFALCREPAPGEALPVWIDPADVEAARAADPTILEPDPSAVLPTSSWAGCIVPLTDREHRMPITCEATAAGVEIDPSMLTPGSWSIWAYTYQPAMNVWRPRPGVVRVRASGSDDPPGPAIAFAYPMSETTISVEAGLVLTGCVAADPGTTVELSVAATGDLAAFGDAAWTAFSSQTIDDGGGELEVAFVPAPDSAYRVLAFRAVATDPAGRESVAYARHPVIVTPGCAVPEGGREPVQDVCGVGDGGPEPTDRGAGTSAIECASAGEPEPLPEPDPEDDGDASDDASSPPHDIDDAGTVSDEPGDRDGSCRIATKRRSPAWFMAALALLLSAKRGRARARGSRAAHARDLRAAPRPTDPPAALPDRADRTPPTPEAGA